MVSLRQITLSSVIIIIVIVLLVLSSSLSNLSFVSAQSGTIDCSTVTSSSIVINNQNYGGGWLVIQRSCRDVDITLTNLQNVAKIEISSDFFGGSVTITDCTFTAIRDGPMIELPQMQNVKSIILLRNKRIYSQSSPLPNFDELQLINFRKNVEFLPLVNLTAIRADGFLRVEDCGIEIIGNLGLQRSLRTVYMAVLQVGRPTSIFSSRYTGGIFGAQKVMIKNNYISMLPVSPSTTTGEITTNDKAMEIAVANFRTYPNPSFENCLSIEISGNTINNIRTNQGLDSFQMFVLDLDGALNSFRDFTFENNRINAADIQVSGFLRAMLIRMEGRILGLPSSSENNNNNNELISSLTFSSNFMNITRGFSRTRFIEIEAIRIGHGDFGGSVKNISSFVVSNNEAHCQNIGITVDPQYKEWLRVRLLGIVSTLHNTEEENSMLKHRGDFLVTDNTLRVSIYSPPVGNNNNNAVSSRQCAGQVMVVGIFFWSGMAFWQTVTIRDFRIAPVLEADQQFIEQSLPSFAPPSMPRSIISCNGELVVGVFSFYNIHKIEESISLTNLRINFSREGGGEIAALGRKGYFEVFGVRGAYWSGVGTPWWQKEPASMSSTTTRRTSSNNNNNNNNKLRQLTISNIALRIWRLWSRADVKPGGTSTVKTFELSHTDGHIANWDVVEVNHLSIRVVYPNMRTATATSALATSSVLPPLLSTHRFDLDVAVIELAGRNIIQNISSLLQISDVFLRVPPYSSTPITTEIMQQQRLFFNLKLGGPHTRHTSRNRKYSSLGSDWYTLLKNVSNVQISNFNQDVALGAAAATIGGSTSSSSSSSDCEMQVVSFYHVNLLDGFGYQSFRVFDISANHQFFSGGGAGEKKSSMGISISNKHAFDEDGRKQTGPLIRNVSSFEIKNVDIRVTGGDGEQQQQTSSSSSSSSLSVHLLWVNKAATIDPTTVQNFSISNANLLIGNFTSFAHHHNLSSGSSSFSIFSYLPSSTSSSEGSSDDESNNNNDHHDQIALLLLTMQSTSLTIQNSDFPQGNQNFKVVGLIQLGDDDQDNDVITNNNNNPRYDFSSIMISNCTAKIENVSVESSEYDSIVLFSTSLSSPLALVNSLQIDSDSGLTISNYHSSSPSSSNVSVVSFGPGGCTFGDSFILRSMKFHIINSSSSSNKNEISFFSTRGEFQGSDDDASSSALFEDIIIDIVHHHHHHSLSSTLMNNKNIKMFDFQDSISDFGTVHFANINSSINTSLSFSCNITFLNVRGNIENLESSLIVEKSSMMINTQDKNNNKFHDQLQQSSSTNKIIVAMINFEGDSIQNIHDRIQISQLHFYVNSSSNSINSGTNNNKNQNNITFLWLMKNERIQGKSLSSSQFLIHDNEMEVISSVSAAVHFIHQQSPSSSSMLTQISNWKDFVVAKNKVSVSSNSSSSSSHSTSDDIEIINNNNFASFGNGVRIENIQDSINFTKNSFHVMMNAASSLSSSFIEISDNNNHRNTSTISSVGRLLVSSNEVILNVMTESSVISNNQHQEPQQPTSLEFYFTTFSNTDLSSSVLNLIEISSNTLRVNSTTDNNRIFNGLTLNLTTDASPASQPDMNKKLQIHDNHYSFFARRRRRATQPMMMTSSFFTNITQNLTTEIRGMFTEIMSSSGSSLSILHRRQSSFSSSSTISISRNTFEYDDEYSPLEVSTSINKNSAPSNLNFDHRISPLGIYVMMRKNSEGTTATTTATSHQAVSSSSSISISLSDNHVSSLNFLGPATSFWFRSRDRALSTEFLKIRSNFSFHLLGGLFSHNDHSSLVSSLNLSISNCSIADGGRILVGTSVGNDNSNNNSNRIHFSLFESRNPNVIFNNISVSGLHVNKRLHLLPFVSISQDRSLSSDGNYNHFFSSSSSSSSSVSIEVKGLVLHQPHDLKNVTIEDVVIDQIFVVTPEQPMMAVISNNNNNNDMNQKKYFSVPPQSLQVSLFELSSSSSSQPMTMMLEYFHVQNMHANIVNLSSTMVSKLALIRLPPLSRLSSSAATAGVNNANSSSVPTIIITISDILLTCNSTSDEKFYKFPHLLTINSVHNNRDWAEFISAIVDIEEEGSQQTQQQSSSSSSIAAYLVITNSSILAYSFSTTFHENTFAVLNLHHPSSSIVSSLQTLMMSNCSISGLDYKHREGSLSVGVFLARNVTFSNSLMVDFSLRNSHIDIVDASSHHTNDNNNNRQKRQNSIEVHLAGILGSDIMETHNHQQQQQHHRLSILDSSLTIHHGLSSSSTNSNNNDSPLHVSIFSKSLSSSELFFSNILIDGVRLDAQNLRAPTTMAEVSILSIGRDLEKAGNQQATSNQMNVTVSNSIFKASTSPKTTRTLRANVIDFKDDVMLLIMTNNKNNVVHQIVSISNVTTSIHTRELFVDASSMNSSVISLISISSPHFFTAASMKLEISNHSTLLANVTHFIAPFSPLPNSNNNRHIAVTVTAVFIETPSLRMSSLSVSNTRVISIIDKLLDSSKHRGLDRLSVKETKTSSVYHQTTFDVEFFAQHHHNGMTFFENSLHANVSNEEDVLVPLGRMDTFASYESNVTVAFFVVDRHGSSFSSSRHQSSSPSSSLSWRSVLDRNEVSFQFGRNHNNNTKNWNKNNNKRFPFFTSFVVLSSSSRMTASSSSSSVFILSNNTISKYPSRGVCTSAKCSFLRLPDQHHSKMSGEWHFLNNSMNLTDIEWNYTTMMQNDNLEPLASVVAIFGIDSSSSSSSSSLANRQQSITSSPFGDGSRNSYSIIIFDSHHFYPDQGPKTDFHLARAEIFSPSVPEILAAAPTSSSSVSTASQIINTLFKNAHIRLECNYWSRRKEAQFFVILNQYFDEALLISPNNNNNNNNIEKLVDARCLPTATESASMSDSYSVPETQSSSLTRSLSGETDTMPPTLTQSLPPRQKERIFTVPVELSAVINFGSAALNAPFAFHMSYRANQISKIASCFGDEDQGDDEIAPRLKSMEVDSNPTGLMVGSSQSSSPQYENSEKIKSSFRGTILGNFLLLFVLLLASYVLVYLKFSFNNRKRNSSENVGKKKKKKKSKKEKKKKQKKNDTGDDHRHQKTDTDEETKSTSTLTDEIRNYKIPAFLAPLFSVYAPIGASAFAALASSSNISYTYTKMTIADFALMAMSIVCFFVLPFFMFRFFYLKTKNAITLTPAIIQAQQLKQENEEENTTTGDDKNEKKRKKNKKSKEKTEENNDENEEQEERQTRVEGRRKKKSLLRGTVAPFFGSVLCCRKRKSSLAVDELYCTFNVQHRRQEFSISKKSTAVALRQRHHHYQSENDDDENDNEPSSQPRRRGRERQTKRKSSSSKDDNNNNNEKLEALLQMGFRSENDIEQELLEDKHEEQALSQFSSVGARWYHYLCDPSIEWKESDFVDKWSLFFDPYYFIWFAGFDYFIGIFLGSLGEVHCATRGCCEGITISALLVSTVYFFALFYFDPFVNRFDGAMVPLGGFLTFVISIFVFLIQFYAKDLDFEKADERLTVGLQVLTYLTSVLSFIMLIKGGADYYFYLKENVLGLGVMTAQELEAMIQESNNNMMRTTGNNSHRQNENENNNNGGKDDDDDLTHNLLGTNAVAAAAAAAPSKKPVSIFDIAPTMPKRKRQALQEEENALARYGNPDPNLEQELLSGLFASPSSSPSNKNTNNNNTNSGNYSSPVIHTDTRQQKEKAVESTSKMKSNNKNKKKNSKAGEKEDKEELPKLHPWQIAENERREKRRQEKLKRQKEQDMELHKKIASLSNNGKDFVVDIPPSASSDEQQQQQQQQNDNEYDDSLQSTSSDRHRRDENEDHYHEHYEEEEEEEFYEEEEEQDDDEDPNEGDNNENNEEDHHDDDDGQSLSGESLTESESARLLGIVSPRN